MFIEWMNTLSGVLVPQLYSLIITWWNNQTIIWRKSARNIFIFLDQKILIIKAASLDFIPWNLYHENNFFCKRSVTDYIEMHTAATDIWWNNVCKYVCTAYLAQRTQLMCWLREKRNFCLWTAHTLMVLSSEAVTRVCPSDEKLTLRTEAVWALKNVDSAFLYIYTNTDNKKTLKTCGCSEMCFWFCAGWSTG